MSHDLLTAGTYPHGVRGMYRSIVLTQPRKHDMPGIFGYESYNASNTIVTRFFWIDSLTNLRTLTTIPTDQDTQGYTYLMANPSGGFFVGGAPEDIETDTRYKSSVTLTQPSIGVRDAGGTSYVEITHSENLKGLIANTGAGRELAIRSDDGNGSTVLIQVRDVDGSAWDNILTCTSGNTPTMDIVADGGVTFGSDGAGFDINIYSGTAGASVVFDASEDHLKFTNAHIEFAGDYSALGHCIHVTTTTSFGTNKPWYVGAWGSMAQFDDGGGLFRMYGQVQAGGGVSALGFIRANTASTSSLSCFQFYTDCDAGTPGPNSLSGIDVFCILNANAFTAAGGLGGMHAGWFKVSAAVSCTVNSDVFALWVDSQMYAPVGGVEYTIFGTTGGTVPDGFIGLQTTSSGWAHLIVFDSTMTGKNPVAGAVDTDGNDSDISLKILYNGTTYYVPAYVAAKLV